MEKLFSLITRVCFQGHTHVPGVFNSDNRFVRSENVPARFKLIDGQLKWMVNVGSVGQPRDGDPRSCYVIWEDSTVTFRRVSYDIERTVSEIEAEPDLDDMLGYRLREGR
jgi:diadenosine tetraphosphatase ApaH/serine/threonine PP2A family protein phosphatase